MLSTRVPTVLSYRGTGISTCCPSATAPALALGPDLPRADQLYSGNLGYSAGRIPTFLSLLIPAFSLDFETTRSGDVFQIDTAESGSYIFHSLNDLFGVLGVQTDRYSVNTLFLQEKYTLMF